MPFGNIYYWAHWVNANNVSVDLAEHYEKMSYRNRYYIATAHGKQCLTIPLVAGRNQRAAMKDVIISYAENWRQQHWRTIYSAYNRSPYFEYYKDELESFFLKEYESLVDFNIASIEWIKKQLSLNIEIVLLNEYQKEYSEVLDLRSLKPNETLSIQFQAYYQVFEERNDFIPNLSVLDLLFNEGKYALEYLRRCEL